MGERGGATRVFAEGLRGIAAFHRAVLTSSRRRAKVLLVEVVGGSGCLSPLDGVGRIAPEVTQETLNANQAVGTAADGHFVSSMWG